jgi:hypothetical protein
MGTGICLDPIFVLESEGVTLITLREQLGICDGTAEGENHFQPITARGSKQHEDTGILLEEFPQFVESPGNMIDIEDHVARRLKELRIALAVGEAGECEIRKELLQARSIYLIGGIADSGDLGL